MGLLVFQSCQDKSSNDISKVFKCKINTKLSDLETTKDFKNNFSVSVPKYWNTKLYYDSKQSEIFSADTIKNLSESYIMDFSVINSEIKIDEKLQEKVAQKLQNNAMKTLQEKFYKFRNLDAYSNLSIGKSRELDLYVFQTYIKINKEKHLLIKTEYYGKEGFDKRFCESLALIDKIKILKQQN
jgi:hypothetical protein